jgi:cytochrome c-type biogenesis protein
VLVGLLMVTGLWQDLNTWLQSELVNGFEVAV